MYRKHHKHTQVISREIIHENIAKSVKMLRSTVQPPNCEIFLHEHIELFEIPPHNPTIFNRVRGFNSQPI